MSCVAPCFPPPPLLLSATNNLRLTEQDLTIYPPFSSGLSASSTSFLPPSHLSLSPASLNRSTFADLISPSPRNCSPTLISRSAFADNLLSKSKLINPLQSHFNRAAPVPRSVSTWGSAVRKHDKENKGNAIESPKNDRNLNKGPRERKRPTRLCIPETARLASLGKAEQFMLPEQDNSALDTHSYEAALFAVSSKRGRKDHMEDAHTASIHFGGNPKHAFFGVFDGHGGQHAADFAAADLGRHISAAILNQKDEDACLEAAMRTGYKTADTEFLNKHVGSGAAAVSAFLKEGEMVIANAGDCKAVLCKAGRAEDLSTSHRASNEEERQRVEDLGGSVDCFNGVWRVQGTLAVTRGFGDASLKQWVSAEPAVKKIDITRDCEFLILASDGLWDQMSDQEAVDCARNILVEADVLSNDTRGVDFMTPLTCEERKSAYHASLHAAQNKEDNPQASTLKTNACNELIRISSSRGNRDDITVMIVLLQSLAIV